MCLRCFIFLFAIVPLITGCRSDPWSATKLVKTHPRLQSICDYAGGCGHVKIMCSHIDNSGMSFVLIKSRDLYGVGWRDDTIMDRAGLSYSEMVEEAISDFELTRYKVQIGAEIVYAVPDPQFGTECKP